jgi:hypothetical protein
MFLKCFSYHHYLLPEHDLCTLFNCRVLSESFTIGTFSLIFNQELYLNNLKLEIFCFKPFATNNFLFFRGIAIPSDLDVQVASMFSKVCFFPFISSEPVLRIRSRIRMRRIRLFLGLPDPDSLVRVTDPDPDLCIMIHKANIIRKTLIATVL